MILKGTNRLEEAELETRRVLALVPSHVDALINLCQILLAAERTGEAEAVCRQAVLLAPPNRGLAGTLMHIRQHHCAWGDRERDERKVLEEVRLGLPTDLLPFTLLASAAFGPELQKKAGQAYMQYLHGDQSIADVSLLAGRQTGSRLRIGYLSGNFQEHPVAHLVTGVIESHDREGLDVFLYSYGPDATDAYRTRLKDSGWTFREIAGITDIDAARRIAEDGIDILVDLMGFTAGTRSGISQRRPAPVIVNWLGYPGTLGDPRIADYVIGDPVTTPAEAAPYYSEIIAQMPYCYQPNDRSRVVGETPTREAAGLPAAGVVFCCFNQSYKITPEVFDIWCRLIDAVPDSVLWLIDTTPVVRSNLQREAQARGVDPARLVFAPRVPLTEHLGRLKLADIALDTFPYTSHTTGSDALWAGVPLVTRMGDTFASRVAASLLNAIGMNELVVNDAEAYFELCRSLANDAPRRQALRDRLAAQREIAPLFDTTRFTRDLEALYQRIWSQHLSGTREILLAQSA
jgi:predicted O-linked N-acetylglucosamine transferase (SPINDLY family)